MNIEAVLELYKNVLEKKGITEKFSQNKKLHLEGLVCSADAFIAAAAFKSIGKNHIFILNDQEEAAYFQDDLKNLLPKKDILYFPDSFKRPGHFEEVNNSNVLLRAETVSRLINSATTGEIIVTYPEALLEKIVSKENLQKDTIHIEAGERLDVDFIIELLVGLHFERTDFVYEPGQFSIRGGIVDIFSFGNELPYRIELFDDEVESIRTFDPVSQLSEKRIRKVTIVPNIQTSFEATQKGPLFDFLPEQTCIWAKNIQFTADTLRSLLEKAKEIASSVGDAEGGKNQLHINDFIEEEIFLAGLQNFPVIEIGTKNYFNSESIAFNITPQPHFNRNFDLLIKNLKENRQKNIYNLLFTENARQAERFHHIFEDLKVDVQFEPVIKSISKGFIDKDNGIACYTDHQIFNRYHKYKLKQGYSRNKALLMKTLRELEPGDYVTHIDHGVGVYSGLEKIEVNGQLQEAVRLIYQNNDLLYVNINSLHKISKYVGKDGKQPRVNKLGSDAWEQLKRKTKKKVKDIAQDLIKLYAERKAQKGFAFAPDTYLQDELEASFIYEDTPDQTKTTQDVKEDMQAQHPMDRLVCGDVGFGKTEIAIRAAFKAVTDNKQVAVLVPTTILALQHYKTFKERLQDFPCTIDYLNRFKSAKEKRETLEKLAKGEVDIIIGTHALLSKKIEYKDLGLLVIDEEQKFGVTAKEKIRLIKVNVDTLTLTATPIPRTLQFSLMGARDLSVINTPPPNRQPINTELHVWNEDIIADAIHFETTRGGQVFFVHNRVKNIQEIADLIKSLCPDVEIGVAHGQMEGDKLEEIMQQFIDHKFDVLICTNIVESGLDIPNANTIIINNAHQFGLSDLHQLRGRVGRSNKKAFCYLLAPPLYTLNSESRKRLKTIEEFADLGSGFNIAMRDLDIRGAGNLLGGEQSGFIAEIGYDMYHKILDEAIQELKETQFKDLFKEELKKKTTFVKDCQIETDLEVMIPDRYVTSINERLSLYTELSNIKNEEKLQKFEQELNDRFGPLPVPVRELLDTVRIRWKAEKLGFERILLKKNTLHCYFIQNQDSPFYESDIFHNILNYLQQHQELGQLKQTAKYLILKIENINNLQQANSILKVITEKVLTAQEVI